MRICLLEEVDERLEIRKAVPNSSNRGVRVRAAVLAFPWKL
jgi:hypothetical protein